MRSCRDLPVSINENIDRDMITKGRKSFARQMPRTNPGALVAMWKPVLEHVDSHYFRLCFVIMRLSNLGFHRDKGFTELPCQ
jgi:hypothetical protein